MAGLGETRLGGLIQNQGTIEVQQGTLILDGGGDSTGAFTAAAGATLSFDTGKFNLLAGSAVNGAGTVKTQGNPANVNDLLTVSGTYTPANTLIVGGTVKFTESPSLASLTIAGGNLEVGRTLTVLGPLNWSKGRIQGGGQTVAQGGMTLDTANSDLQLDGHRLINRGAAIWTGRGQVMIYNGAVFRNAAEGTFEIRVDRSFYDPKWVPPRRSSTRASFARRPAWARRDWAG